jgi:ribosomal protein L17
LPERYQQWITGEINRILRDVEKEESSTAASRNQDNTQQAVWRRENDIRSELEKSKLELANLVDKVVETEKKCDYLKHQAVIAEEKENQALLELEKTVSKIYNNSNNSSGAEDMMMVLSDEETSSTDDPQNPVLHLNKVATKGMHILLRLRFQFLELLIYFTQDYLDDTSIDVFVYDTAKATNRSASKAQEWVQKLKDQDIMTVGDLRELLDEDWSCIGLTVFAIRAIKNMLRNVDSSSGSSASSS